jgi:RHS repeat-associated protein
MGWTATAKLDDEAPPARGPANDNLVPGGRVAWYRNYHRYYDPGTGRYTQVDPAIRVLGILPRDLTPTGYSGEPAFAYASSNPLVSIDPTGEDGTTTYPWWTLAPAAPLVAPWVAPACLVGVFVIAMGATFASDSPRTQICGLIGQGGPGTGSPKPGALRICTYSCPDGTQITRKSRGECPQTALAPVK